MTEFTEQEEIVVNEILPATPGEIADELGVSESYSWDIAQNLRDKGVNLSTDSQGQYFIPGVTEAESANYSAVTKITSDSKAAITRKVKSYLAELEQQLQDQLERTEPIEYELPQIPDHQDFIGFYTDLHFGQLIKNEYGNVVFDSNIAEQRFNEVVHQGLQRAALREQSGITFDVGHILLGGDIVTNENIYQGQAHEIDETLNDQLTRASGAIIDTIRQYSNFFPAVQVVCTPGNHGEIRTGNSSNYANADTILYDSIQLAIRQSDLDNVRFVRSDASHFVNFKIRDWNAHMRHGHDSSLEHIGTSAGKQRWLQWKDDHDFDVAFRGHYHQIKEEPISGAPVHMGGSITAQSGFEESQAMSSRAAAAVHGATDAAPTHWSERLYLS